MQSALDYVKNIDDISQMRHQSGELYLEFLRVPALSAGIYELATGASDPQAPHNEDEVYYITEGRGQIRIGDDDYRVCAGSVVFVPAYAWHYFHSIEATLRMLVFFAPAESSGSGE